MTEDISNDEATRNLGKFLLSLAQRMMDNPEEFVDLEMEWQPDPLSLFLGHRPTIDLGGHFVILIQKVSHKKKEEG